MNYACKCRDAISWNKSHVFSMYLVSVTISQSDEENNFMTAGKFNR